MPYVPNAHHITRDMDMTWVKALDEDQLLACARLMARASERSYRRGFQQGATIALDCPADLPADLHAWRYENEIDIAPWTDAPRAETALGRLLMENPTLREFGFPRSNIYDGFELFTWPPKPLEGAIVR